MSYSLFSSFLESLLFVYHFTFDRFLILFSPLAYCSRQCDLVCKLWVCVEFTWIPWPQRHQQMEQDLLQVQPNSHAHAHAPAQPSAGAADASSTGWVWWASLKTCTPAASVCIWVANLRSNFQPQHKRHLFSYLCPQAFHPAVPPNAPSLLWFCIICTQKSSQKN